MQKTAVEQRVCKHMQAQQRRRQRYRYRALRTAHHASQKTDLCTTRQAQTTNSTNDDNVFFFESDALGPMFYLSQAQACKDSNGEHNMCVHIYIYICSLIP